jgi:moderate conductance mechanosensitive channel
VKWLKGCKHKTRRQYWLGWFLAGLLLVLSPILSVQVWDVPGAIAQIPGLPASSTPQLPLGVQRSGLLESAPVSLDGDELFRIASPTVYNRAEPGNQVPVEARARQIELNLSQLVAPNPSPEKSTSYSTLLDPETIEVIIESLNNQPVLLVKDAHLVEPRVLLTVTDTDAQYNATTQQELARRWQKILQKGLQKALDIRQPGARKERVNQVVVSLGTMMTAFKTTANH